MKIRTLDIDELNDRLEELETLETALSDERENLKDAETDEAREEIQGRIAAAESDFGEDEALELAALRSLKDDIGESRGKINDEGGPFVHEADFEDYAREFAEDIDAISGRESWPHNCIDWSRAADELKQDYSVVTWKGNDYYYRA